MKKIKLRPSGVELDCPEGETVLSVLEKNGYALPNNCRAGACGECKTKVCSGEYDQGFILDMALPQNEREQGYGLMCMAKVTSDVLEIEYGTEDAKPTLFPPRENMPFIVTEKFMVTPSIAKVFLRPLGEGMRFWPGQYVQVQDNEEKLPKRCYSIANIPNTDNEIVLNISKLTGGKVSSWIHDDIQVGTTLKVHGPYGTFIGNPSAKKPVLCLAGGSGLAPITSLASAAMLRGGFKFPATVFFSAKTAKDLYDVGLYKYLTRKFKNFKFRYTLTQEQPSDESAHYGRIPLLLPELYPDLSEYEIYIAGAPGFVENCLKSCKELGAKDESLYTESYTPQT